MGKLGVPEGLQNELVKPLDSSGLKALDTVLSHDLLDVNMETEADSDCLPLESFQSCSLPGAQQGVVDRRAILDYRPDVAAVKLE